jgi:hypothetical protein
MYMKITFFKFIVWVSEWLLNNFKWKIFQLFHGEKKLHFDEMMMMIMSTMHCTKTLSWILIVLAQWYNSPRVYIILMPSQPAYLLLIIDVYLEEK